MEKLEQKLLKSVIKNLKKSTKKSWTYGDLGDWRDWAQKMRGTINNNIGVLESLLDEVEEIEGK